MKPIIQIAGIKSLAEAEMLVSAGIEWLGFPLRLHVHSPDLSESLAADIIQALRGRCNPVLITYLEDAHEIFEFMSFLGTSYVQLHGSIDVDAIRKLRQLWGAHTAPNKQTSKSTSGDLFIIKSLVVRADNLDGLTKDVELYSPVIDVFITDTYDPTTGASGATGKTHDWRVSQRLVQVSKRPVILAGGLNHKNVRDAILTVRPAGVDAHTGVENLAGEKDPILVAKFIAAARSAFVEIQVSS